MKSANLLFASKAEILSVLIITEEKLLQATQNLGHPAYGVSSSTTEGIDKLREELFDFLEISNS